MNKVIVCSFDNIDMAEIAANTIKKTYKNIKYISIKYNPMKQYNYYKEESNKQNISNTPIYNMSNNLNIFPTDISSITTDIFKKNSGQTNSFKNDIRLKIIIDSEKKEIDILTTNLLNMGGEKIKVI